VGCGFTPTARARGVPASSWMLDQATLLLFGNRFNHRSVDSPAFVLMIAPVWVGATLPTRHAPARILPTNWTGFSHALWFPARIFWLGTTSATSTYACSPRAIASKSWAWCSSIQSIPRCTAVRHSASLLSPLARALITTFCLGPCPSGCPDSRLVSQRLQVHQPARAMGSVRARSSRSILSPASLAHRTGPRNR
jgi:hypothetical protein